ncbi:MAG: hypothetical protein Q9223_007395, partial [Gallowayella weberi]
MYKFVDWVCNKEAKRFSIDVFSIINQGQTWQQQQPIPYQPLGSTTIDNLVSPVSAIKVNPKPKDLQYFSRFAHDESGPAFGQDTAIRNACKSQDKWSIIHSDKDQGDVKRPLVTFSVDVADKMVSMKRSA